MRKQEGTLTVEATITLTIYLFAMMFLVNVGQVYRAQNYMAHGLLQTGQMLAFSSYEWGTDTTISQIGDECVRQFFALVGTIPGNSDIRIAWKDGGYRGYSAAAKAAFGYCAGKNIGATNKDLERYGIDSINFEKTCRQEDDLCLRVEYQVELPFTFFNISYVKMHQQIVCGLWE